MGESQKTGAQVALSIFKAGISALPGIGGPIANLLGDAAQAHTDRSIFRALDELRQRLEELGDRIDLASANLDDFAELFKSCYLLVVRTHQEEKLRGAASLMTNVLLKEGDSEKMEYTELDHFARCLDFLSIGAVRLLATAYGMATSKGPINLQGRVWAFDFRSLRTQAPSIDPFLMMGLIGELNSVNLLHVRTSGVPEPDYGNYGLELTPLGWRFVKYVLRPETLDRATI